VVEEEVEAVETEVDSVAEAEEVATEVDLVDVAEVVVAVVEEVVTEVDSVDVAEALHEVVVAEEEWEVVRRFLSSLIAIKESSLPEERKTPLSQRTWPLVIQYTVKSVSLSKKKVRTKLNTEYGTLSAPSWLPPFLAVLIRSTCLLAAKFST